MKTTIHIPEPCHENWDKMTPVEKGRFCKVCSKEVVDFTKNTKQEVISYLENNEGVCGLFPGIYIGEETKTVIIETPLSWWRKTQLSFFIVLGFLFAGKNSKAQGKPELVKGNSRVAKDENTNKTEIKLSGSVLMKRESKTTGIPNVGIRVYSEQKLIASTVTIANGRFSVKIPKGSAIENKIRVVAEGKNYTGQFINEEAELAITKNEMNINFYAHENYRTAGTPVLRRTELEEPVKINDTIKHISEQKIHEVKKEIPDSTTVEIIKISSYPNPSDGNYTIETDIHFPIHLMVFSSEGKVIWTKNHVLNKTKIDISAYASGIYFLVATDPKSGQKLSTVKLVKGE